MSLFNRKFIVFVFYLIVSSSFFAQDFSEVKKEINKIKKDSKYIYAESIAESEEDAKIFAEEILYDEINKWIYTQKSTKEGQELIVNNKKELWASLSMPRGTNMYRYFIFVKKSDIVSSDNVLAFSNEQSPKNELEVVKEFKVPSTIKEVSVYTKYNDMANKVMELKKSGKIKSYARYASLENPDLCYLIIYNREGKVVAILTPGNERMNIKTGKPDSVKNYSGCGAIGIEL